MNKEELIEFYNKQSAKREKKKRRNRFYHKMIQRQFDFIIPKGSKVLEIGCGHGDLLNHVEPSYGAGIDISNDMISVAKEKYPHLNFFVQDAENIELNEKFDFIILSDLIGELFDVQEVFNKIKSLVDKDTKIVISYYNSVWEGIIRFGEFFRLKTKQPIHNWLTYRDIENVLKLEDFEVVTQYGKLLLPKYLPIFNFIFNKFIANLPGLNNLTLSRFIVARPLIYSNEEYSISIVVPARNEKGNIENAIKRTPKFSAHQEFIFMEGNSQDDTYDEMLRVQKAYPDYDIKVYKQTGKGKGNAVREAFDKAEGDILMILDADLTTPPEDMPKFYNALKTNKGQFINGCRLVYPMEKQAMRLLNHMGNKFFGFFFSFLLGQRLKDTLCGTKVLFKWDYEKIKNNRSYFGNFDPFGDFDLLFGAAKQNLKIVEIIVRYRSREYGETQISRFKHGWLLIKMSLFAAKKIKFK